MPNWCTNFIEVKGPQAHRFMEINQGKRGVYPGDEPFGYNTGFTMNAVVPIPTRILEAGYSPAGYQWQVDNWGTKWDINSDDIQWCSDKDDPDYLCITFDSAWSPPIPWFKEVARRFLDLEITLSYYELNMWFAGKVEFKDGIITKEEYISDDELPDYMMKEFEMDVSDEYNETK